MTLLEMIFCDWYIEIVKPRLWDKENESRYTVQYILKLLLMHKFKTIASIHAIYNRRNIFKIIS